MKQTNSYENSFTFIELLVVVGIIILFTSVLFPKYNDFTARKKLKAETEKVVDVLELAKKKANTADYSQCGGSINITPKLGDKFSFVITKSTDYKIVPSCLTGTPTPIKYKTDSNIIFPTPTIQVDFQIMNGGSNNSCIIVKDSSFSQCRYVKIESSSLITEGKCDSCSPCPCPSP